LEKKETKDIRCPFCGAPYKKLLSSNVLQLKCAYCGAMYRVPPRIGIDIPQCANHRDRFAVGICDDCQQNFCSDCLEIYDFKTRDGSATLHLCPKCVNKREAGRANSYILGGILVAIFGVIFVGAGVAASARGALVLLPFGIVILIFGIGEIVYGVNRRPSEEAEVYEQEFEAETPEELTVPTEAEQMEEADRLYDELLSKYMEHWGAPTGPQLLDNEIRAYTWHGDTFEQAVAKVYRRQRNKR
jgi:hypothetical protein